jgi:uncharacterized membrane protein
MSRPFGEPRRESRLLPAAIVFLLVIVLVVLPRHYGVLPPWSVVVIGFAMIAFLWSRFERYAVAVFAVVATGIVITILVRLLYEMAAARSETVPIVLLWTAVDIWLANVVVFSLVYWELDRGGPDGRANAWQGQADFYFPRGDAAVGVSVPGEWQPSFTDYLYLAFTTNTAFSPSEIYPLTSRAKWLHMLQSAISYVTIIALAARAINILGK